MNVKDGLVTHLKGIDGVAFLEEIFQKGHFQGNLQHRWKGNGLIGWAQCLWSEVVQFNSCLFWEAIVGFDSHTTVLPGVQRKVGFPLLHNKQLVPPS